MRVITYDRTKDVAARHNGYVKTRMLKENGITDRQISAMVEEGTLEKIAHGCFWHPETGGEKPVYYRAIEMNMTNPRAVVSAFSAAFLHGLMDAPTEKFYFATARDDRHKMILPFETRRYYYPLQHFDKGIEVVSTPHGDYRIYNIDRAMCDCYRFRKEISPDELRALKERYLCSELRDAERLEEYRQLILRSRRIF
ncbi:MAG: type IV toxin-antitoxin system AbiEi family antitoxin domain-containing protein [Mogibacterium sp.]|nr:type IV toxin-antitoxin system AbiEi family antitoxin domain-containing protein [Mogibacterium sp.]